MENLFFIPKKIKVGYQNRNDTYSKKLAYVIYYDEKGKLRKEKSWESWRDSKILADDFDNEPISGFVLNKKAGGDRYSWNPRQTYVRVYDPRGFEIEITIPNLLYILENTDCIKGKGLDGEFIYGWAGTELVLISTASPDYVKITELSEKKYIKLDLKTKDLKEGATYLTKQNEKYIYMGRLDCLNHKKVYIGKQYVFAVKGNGYTYFKNFSSIKDKFIETIDENCVKNYSFYQSELEKTKKYTDITKNKVNTYYTEKEFKEDFTKGDENQEYFTEYGHWMYNRNDGKLNINRVNDNELYISTSAFGRTDKENITIKDFVKRYKPYRLK